MRVLETRITDMRYDADFGRVEACVTLIVKPRPGQPARRLCLRTSQPLLGPSPVEKRLAGDAIRLAELMGAEFMGAGYTGAENAGTVYRYSGSDAPRVPPGSTAEVPVPAPAYPAMQAA